jgi:hypothetical protein
VTYTSRRPRSTPPRAHWGVELPGFSSRREFHEALLDADSFEDLPGKWQAAIVEAVRNRPPRHVVSGD